MQPFQPKPDDLNLPDKAARFCPEHEEGINAATHGLGFVLSVVALCTLSLASYGTRTALYVGCIVYAVTLVMLYGSSTAYHWCRHSKWKTRLRTVDHVCIFLLIAGTYTPFMLAFLQGPLGYTLLAFVWGVAFLGIVFKLLLPGKYDALTTAIYVLLGWVPALAILPVYHMLPAGAWFWLFTGGVSYTVGVWFYRRDHLPYRHACWHLCVVGGSVSQFLGVLLHVIP